jgi:hypothetical protein
MERILFATADALNTVTRHNGLNDLTSSSRKETRNGRERKRERKREREKE